MNLDAVQTQNMLAASFAAQQAAFLFVDVQADYFDRQRLRVRGASEKACVYLPMVASRIARFTRAARKKSGDLSAIFAVHQHDRQLKRCDAEGLRGEIVVPTTERDVILPKKDFCAFSQTDLGFRLHRRGINTLVMGGGILEDCIAATVTTATRDFKMNVVVMPDLTASKEKAEGPEFCAGILSGASRKHLGFLPSAHVLGLMC